jgi:alpha-tubulin suppressor-like RCC1 family protein
VDVSKTFCGVISNVSALAAGLAYSVAADTVGVVWTWGANSSGQLGEGSNTTPSTVPWPIYGVSNIVSVAAGEAHTLALCEDGTVWAWGDDLFGQLGRGVGSGSTDVPAPCLVLTQIVAIAAGTIHCVALQDNGAVWAWGRGISGQLGNGGTADISVPTVLTNIDSVIAIAAGYDHTIALRADKTVWTWGADGAGQLGRSTPDFNDPVPGPVTGFEQRGGHCRWF